MKHLTSFVVIFGDLVLKRKRFKFAEHSLIIKLLSAKSSSENSASCDRSQCVRPLTKFFPQFFGNCGRVSELLLEYRTANCQKKKRKDRISKFSRRKDVWRNIDTEDLRAKIKDIKLKIFCKTQTGFHFQASFAKKLTERFSVSNQTVIEE